MNVKKLKNKLFKSFCLKIFFENFEINNKKKIITLATITRLVGVKTVLLLLLNNKPHSKNANDPSSMQLSVW